MELLIGCGSNPIRRVSIPGHETWTELVTLDMNPAHKPDIVHDLNVRPWPFPDDTFDEVHAYDVMEHLSAQGDYLSFFAEWSEVWRILKPGGMFFGITPDWSDPNAWGDPGHRRVYCPGSLVFLIQPQYTAQVGKTALSDYRFCYRADFDVLHSEANGTTFIFVLMAIKPSRIGCKASPLPLASP